MKNVRPFEPTIHVVDPDAAVHEEIRSVSSYLGARVRAYESGAEFLRAATGGPGCLVVETRLPDMAGLEVLRRVRDRDATFAILMTSSDGSIATATAALRGGADDFLEKPFVERSLVHRLRRLLRQRGSAHDLSFPSGTA